MDRSEGRRVRKFDGPSGRGLWIALRAMLIKSALRDLLSVSYGIVSILLTGSLRSPPPIRLRRTSPYAGGRINRSMLSCRDMAPRLSIHSPTTEWGGRWWRQPPKGENAGMVPEVYDSLFFPSYLSFPLEGKSREVGKGVRGRAPIGCSIAVLTANRRPPSPPHGPLPLASRWHSF